MCTSEPGNPLPAVEATIAADKPLRLELLGVFGPDLKSEFGPHSDIQIFNTKKQDNGGSSPWSHIGFAKTMPSDVLGDESMGMIKQWLEGCLETHDKCQLTGSRVRKLPKRLLFIGDETSPPRLCFSETIPGSRYLALSHCWGKHRPLTTTLATLAERQRQIPLWTLPKTFSDAFTVTHRLGFQHIWIDSLCIVQDSPDDWAEESSKMQDVYENAVLTISADAAFDGTAGLSNPRRSVFRSQAVWGDSLFVSRAGCPSATPPRENKLPTTPLSERAWTLQERLLSRRILHFDRFEALWECRSIMACECQGSWAEQDIRNAQWATNRFFPDDFPPKMDFAVFWANLVEEYTRRRLTYYTDLLPAVAGVASRAASISNNTYLSGLWPQHLRRLLLWIAGRDSMRHPEPYYCPTWSWASVIGTVSFNASQSRFYILKVHQAVCESGPAGPFMPPKSGFLDIEGPMAGIISKDGEWTVDCLWTKTKATIVPDRAGWSEFGDTDDIKFVVVAHNGVPSSELQTDGTFTDVIEESWNWFAKRFYGLVICKVGNSKDTYRRIGWCEYRSFNAKQAESCFWDFFSTVRFILV